MGDRTLHALHTRCNPAAKKYRDLFKILTSSPSSSRIREVPNVIQAGEGRRATGASFPKMHCRQSSLPFSGEQALYGGPGMHVKINFLLPVLESQLSNISTTQLALRAFQPHHSVYAIRYIFYKILFLVRTLLFQAYPINTSCENKPLCISRKQQFPGNN